MTDATLVHERAESPSATLAVTGRHLPALNGLRGIAVIGVVAYHLQLGWAKGGYLGVDLFFVLSGFLITTLLLEEWTGSGRIDLAAFWGRRARRLLPALFLVVAALALYLVCNAVFGGPGANGLIDLSGLRGDAIATLLYVNNWHLIYAHQSYFAQFSTPSPLQHTWSLAIEEQFYLVWPLVLLVLLRFGRRGWRRLGVTLTVVLGVGSSVLMAVLFNPPADPSRVYYGTDTRLFDLMAGATLAFLVASRGQPGARSRRALHWVGPAAAVVLAVFWVRAGTSGGLPTNFMFEGGFLLCAALGGLIVADAAARRARAVRSCPGLAATALHRHHLLWDLPVALARDRLPQRRPDRLVGMAPQSPPGRGHPARLHCQLLPRRAPHPLGQVAGWPPGVDRPTGRCRHRRGDRRRHHSGRRRSAQCGGHHPPRLVGLGRVGAGAGGYTGQQPIALTPAPSPANPLRVMIIGDSVMHDASFGITASLQATGEATVSTKTYPGFGLTTATSWRTSIPSLIAQTHAQLIVASWSWDQYGPTTPNALHQPKQYTALLRSAVATMLAPGDGVEGVIFTEFPQSGTSPRPIRPILRATTGSAGPASSPGTTSRRRWSRCFPAGSCTSHWPIRSCCTARTRPGSHLRAPPRAE